MRLIDADELMQRCYKELKECTGEDFKEGIRWMMVDVVELPTVDAVPVVRCGECKHKHIKSTVWVCNFGMLMPGAEGYCSYGEKVSE